jgi:hypothetical protein
MRPAWSVDHDQKIVAQRIVEEGSGERQQLLVGGRDLVEVAVVPHEREEVGQVLLPHGFDHQNVMPPNMPPVTLRTWPLT